MSFSGYLLIISFIPDKIAILSNILQSFPYPPQIWILDTPESATGWLEQSPVSSKNSKDTQLPNSLAQAQNYPLQSNSLSPMSANLNLPLKIPILDMTQTIIPTHPFFLIPVNPCEEESWKNLLQSEFYQANPFLQNANNIIILSRPTLNPDGTSCHILHMLHKFAKINLSQPIICEMQDEVAFPMLKYDDTIILSNYRTWLTAALIIIQQRSISDGNSSESSQIWETSKGNWAEFLSPHIHLHTSSQQLSWISIFIGAMLGAALGLGIGKLFF